MVSCERYHGISDGAYIARIRVRMALIAAKRDEVACIELPSFACRDEGDATAFTSKILASSGCVGYAHECCLRGNLQAVDLHPWNGIGQELPDLGRAACLHG